MRKEKNESVSEGGEGGGEGRRVNRGSRGEVEQWREEGETEGEVKHWRESNGRWTEGGMGMGGGEDVDSTNL